MFKKRGNLDLSLKYLNFKGVQFEGPRLLSVSESDSTVELTLTRVQGSSSNPETAIVEFLTVDQYLNRLGSSLLCQLQAADLGLANSSTFDAAEGEFMSHYNCNIYFCGYTTCEENLV